MPPLRHPDKGRRCHVEPDRKTHLWLVTRRREKSSLLQLIDHCMYRNSRLAGETRNCNNHGESPVRFAHLGTT
jgi:hypothetical protein